MLAAAGIGLFGAALLVEERQAWAAGKALSYAAPLPDDGRSVSIRLTSIGLESISERR